MLGGAWSVATERVSLSDVRNELSALIGRPSPDGIAREYARGALQATLLAEGEGIIAQERFYGEGDGPITLTWDFGESTCAVGFYVDADACSLYDIPATATVEQCYRSWGAVEPLAVFHLTIQVDTDTQTARHVLRRTNVQTRVSYPPDCK